MDVGQYDALMNVYDGIGVSPLSHDQNVPIFFSFLFFPQVATRQLALDSIRRRVVYHRSLVVAARSYNCAFVAMLVHRVTKSCRDVASRLLIGTIPSTIGQLTALQTL